MKIQKAQDAYIIIQINDQNSVSYTMDVNQRIQIDEYILQLQYKEKAYLRYYLENNISIGRDYFNDLCITNQNISKTHAKIYFNQGWVIEDLDSKNGVYVNRKRVKKKRLEIGDLISIVGYDIYFCDIFITVSNSVGTRLRPFKPILSIEQQEIPNELVILDDVQQPILVNRYHHLEKRMGDIVHPVVYLLIMLMYKQISYFIWISIFNILYRSFEKIGCYYKERKQKKAYLMELNKYQNYLKNKYPSVNELAKITIISTYDNTRVRIGSNSKGVCLYDFKEYPNLAIIGEMRNTKKLLIQIIYQILRFYPNVKVELNQVFIELLFMKPNSNANLTLGVNKKGDYTIDLLTELTQSSKLYDGIINLNEGWYYCGVKEELLIDDLDNSFIVSDLYDEQLHLDKSFFNLTELSFKELNQIRLSISNAISVKGILGYSNENLSYLDLHEQKQGPHLLVVGMSGSGKSEWLTSYLLSMAIYYDSDDVQFFVIDFKGGLLCLLFEQLHHTCMVLSNLENYQIHRAIAALEDELSYRENLLLQVSLEVSCPINDIHQLKKLYNQKKTTVNMAHLMVVVDEFAELKMSYPEMMDALIRISRTGRSLGIHLVLSTQRATGVIDRQIESNIQTTICFKVASKQDSYDAIGNAKSFYLEKAGDLICKNGNDEIYSHTLFLEQHSIFRFYDLNKNEQYQFSIQSKNQSNKLFCINQINRDSKKCKPLYIKDFLTVKFESFGIYDDYKHRCIKFFDKRDVAFIIGAIIEDKEICVKNINERIIPRELMGDLGVIFFDSQILFNTLMKKVTFEINKEKGLGAFYLKGEVYQCRISSPVI